MKTTRGFSSTTKTASKKPTSYTANLGNAPIKRKAMAKVPSTVQARFPKK